LRKLKIGAPLGLGIAALHLSRELGYFREVGFDAEITEFVRAAEGTAALAGDKLEVLLASQETAWLNAILRGAPIRAVAGREVMSPSCRRMAFLAALKSRYPSGLGNLRVLKGKRVIAGSGIGVLRFALTQHLAQDGLGLKDVDIVNLTGSDAMAALFSGSVDAMIVFDESLLPEKHPELVFSRGLAELHPNYQYGLILFGRRLREQDPRVGRSFLRAYFRGVQAFINGKTPKFVQQFADYRGADAGKMAAMCRANYVLDGNIDRESLTLFVDWAFQHGYLPRRPDVSELVDPRFLEKPNV
jgi:ABC-type nitrate/sulfonate/bicarbonate transport system substrate-binding protein